jgi:hypothetical protein
MRLVAESLGNTSNLGDYEYLLSEGESGEVRFYISEPLSQDTINQMQNDIISQGVVLTGPIIQDVGTLIIPFRKELAPLLIIAAVAIPIVGGLLGWQIFSFSKLGVPVWVWGVAAVGLLLLFMGSETGKKATGMAISAGKMYITKGAFKNPRVRT